MNLSWQKLRRFRLTALAAVQVLLGFLAFGQPDQRCLDATKISVARVTCQVAGVLSVSTAFLYPDDAHAVTTLHSVSGSQDIQIKVRRPDGTYFETKATVLKTLPHQDLALLQLRQPSGAPSLQFAEQRVSAGETLVALGFPRGVEAVLTDTVIARRTDQYGPLGSFVPAEVRRALVQGSELLKEDSEVLNLEGALRPGNSGCPIVNSRCEVVAIGNGGIDQGTTSWSWGIPAASVGRLKQDTAAVQPTLGRPGGIRFAAVAEADVEREVPDLRLGGEPFVFTQTRRLGDIRTSAAIWNSDDPLGLAQILVTIRASIPGFDPDELRLDVYSHLASGAALTLPAGVRLQSEGDYARGSLADGAIEILSAFFRRSDAMAIQLASQEFERRLVPPSLLVQIDPQWSYAQFNPNLGQLVIVPRSRYDGLVFIRKAAFAYESGPFGPVPRGYMFETLASRGSWLLASSARSNKPIPEIASQHKLATQWAGAVVSVHLTSFK